MVLSADRQRVKTLLTETITLLCKNGLHFKSGFSIEALIGITLDEDDVFLVSIKETIHPAVSGLSNSHADHGRRGSFGLGIPDSHRVEPDVHPELERRERWQECESISPRANYSTGSTSKIPGTDRQRRSPDVVNEIDLRTNLKRRLSESDEEPYHAANSCGIRLPPDLTFPASSVVNEDLISKERFETRSFADNPVSSEDRDNAKEFHHTGRESSGSCEAIGVKQEPDDEDPPFQRNDSSNVEMNSSSMNHDDVYPSALVVSKPPLFHSWSDYQQFGQHEFLASAKQQNNQGLDQTLSVDSLDHRHRLHHYDRDVEEVSVPHHRKANAPRSKQLSRAHSGQGALHSHRYECPYCGKRFSATNNLRGHLVKHTGIKEFVCHLCGNEYAFKQKLKYHLNIVHNCQL